MKIGDKLKDARLKKSMTQEEVAEKLFVSRQSISNWENNKTYPDIGNVIALSDLYQISLDELLKGSDNFMKHLEESTDIVKSNKKLIFFIILVLIAMIVMAIFTEFLPEKVFLVAIFSLSVIVTGVVYSEIIKRF
ncbi:helix-turn-helix domain-containing protein [uncultured Anaerococcus sp.]|uniref:helix-turn-helix domain-containing protein n=1 Tax=uncultured Anaerococcus sp. TaxID=293428 RepID=UPI002805C026|nr:helix-turn-helix domain-containing protein [uncultured Anaerococcus sp.]